MKRVSSTTVGLSSLKSLSSQL